MTATKPKAQHEQAPMLVTFGELAGRVASLVRLRPELLPRLAFAPRSAIHATAAFLHLSHAASESDAEVAEVIIQTAPRELLRAALPGCPSRLYRALDRAGDRVRDRRFYQRLAAVSEGPFALALLDGALDDTRLAYYEALSSMDPAMATLHGGLKENKYTAEAVDCLLAILRAHGSLRDSDLRLPSRAGLPAIARRLHAALGRIEAPDPGFASPAPFRFVRTSAELQRIGRAFGNCVALHQWGAAQHHLNLIDGTAVFLVSDTPPLLALLRRVAHGVWYADQVCGPANAPPPPGTRSSLLRGLTDAGLKLVAVDGPSSLGRVGQEGRYGRVAEAEEDVLDDQNEDGIAA